MFEPGNFSKNFGWGSQKGLQKLRHDLINGFGAKFEPISRKEFEKNGELAPEIGLYLQSYFIPSTQENGTVFHPDELTIQAYSSIDIETFDHLAFFALLQNCEWLNHLFREHIWINGKWDHRKLSDKALKDWISKNVNATPQVQTKCFTNLRRILLIAYPGYLVGNFDEDTRFLWISASFYLIWDRYLIEHNKVMLDFKKAKKLLDDGEIHKLIPTTEDEIDDYFEDVYKNYTQSRGLDRIKIAKISKHNKRNLKEDSRIVISKLKMSSIPVDKQLRAYYQLVRDKGLARTVKEIYQDECQFCGQTTIVGIDPDLTYSEAAHIQPISEKGPDSIDNLIVLCSKHHIQFDRGLLSLEIEKNKIIILSKISSDDINRKQIRLKKGHSLNTKYINWHRNNIYI
jgi:hypothetical protein